MWNLLVFCFIQYCDFIHADITILEVTLRVQDKNDEKPVFKNKPVPFLAAVPTSPGLGETVYTLYAEDPDLNSNLVYNLESGRLP